LALKFLEIEKEFMTPLVLRDSDSGAEARILPELGFNCFSLKAQIRGELVEILNSEPGFELGDKSGTRSGIPWLFPFPNRIQQGRFSWDGQAYTLPGTDGRGNAIHGFVKDRPWRVTAVAPQSVTAEFQLSLDAPDKIALWPGDFLIEVRYQLEATSLRADIRIMNPGPKPLPWGLGTHPYFNIPLTPNGDVNQCRVRVPASQAWELSDFIPTGQRTALDARNDLQVPACLGGKSLDDVLTQLKVEAGRTEVALIDGQLGYQVTQISDAVFRECVVFTPPGRACVCLEPYTCTTNAMNLQQQGIDAGLQILEPGAEFRTWIEIRVAPVKS
jgi:aldose 1-epimerase